MNKALARFLFHDEVAVTVPLGRAERTSPRGGWLLRGPVADKFFLSSALAAFFGVVWFGAHLWLMRNGQMPVAASYRELRSAHVQLQIYLFFGLAIIGFLLQAAPRFLELRVRPGSRALWMIPGMCFGALLVLVAPGWWLAQGTLALPFVLMLVSAGQLLRAAAAPLRRQFGCWILLSLSGFVVGVFLSGMGPDRWLLVFWISIAPMVLGIGQQFIRAFVTGRTVDGWRQWAFPALSGVSSVLMAWGYLSGDALPWRLAGVSVGILAVGYVLTLRLWNIREWRNRGVLCWAFAISYTWLVVGAFALVISGSAALDSVLHMWALGWVCPLLFSISSQIMENLAGSFLLSRKVQLLFFVLWQVVPFGRSGTLLSLPPRLSMVVAIICSLVFLSWGISIAVAAWSMLRNQRQSVADRSR